MIYRLVCGFIPLLQAIDAMLYYLAMNAPRLALISLQNTFIDFGVRYIAAAARSAGYPTEVLWICEDIDSPLHSSDLNAVARFLISGQFALVGISVMSIHYTRATQLTRVIRKETGLPVLWGGIHAILSPEQCLEDADFVCVGDGESSIVQLLDSIKKRNPHQKIDNIWYREQTEIIRTPGTVITDLNAYPFPDYQLDNHHILRNATIEHCTEDILKQHMPWSHLRHYVITSRGCPYNCSYCSNSALREILGTDHALRFRTVENVITEIRSVKERFPFIRAFAIMDDSFFFKPAGWVEDFCRQFESIDASFGVLIHPRTVTRERMEMLIRAGLIGVQMGLQSGSDRTNRDIYLRPEPVSEFVRAAGVLDEFMDRLMVRTYDVIVDNPFEDDEDRAETVRILSHLNKPFHLDLFSLTLFPGTTLFKRAKSENPTLAEQLKPEDKNYLEIAPTMLNRLTWLTHTTAGGLIRFFLRYRRRFWCRMLFRFYDCVWERGLRLSLRRIKKFMVAKLILRHRDHRHRNAILKGMD